MELANAFITAFSLAHRYWFPAFCIAGTVLIVYVHRKISRQNPFVSGSSADDIMPSDGCRDYGREYDEDIYD